MRTKSVKYFILMTYHFDIQRDASADWQIGKQSYFGRGKVVIMAMNQFLNQIKWKTLVVMEGYMFHWIYI